MDVADLFIVSYSKSKSNLLFLNDCSGGFTNITQSSGVASVTSSSTGVAFLDVNLDGYLDIYVVNYIDTRKFTYNESGEISGFDHDCFPNHLFVNNGDETFSEMGEVFGVADIGCGLAVLPTDYDQDGDQDLLVVNDFGQWVQPNGLYENKYPDNSFIDVSASTGMDIGIYGMGATSGDFDNDGDLDYYITNLGSNVLMMNTGDDTFLDVADGNGVDNTTNADGTNTTSWGCFFFDYDNDTNLDLFVSNGHITASPFLNTTENDANALFHNVADDGFSNVASRYGLDNVEINRGAIYGDYDNNGTLDVFAIATSLDGSGVSSLYENEFNTNNWIDIKLKGTLTNRDAYGAWAYLYLGEKRYMKELSVGGSHASQHSSILHFGLGSAVHIDKLEIVWPLGEKQVFENLNVNQRIKIEEGEEGYDILGCLDSRYDNYNPNATINAGCITSKIVGCTNSLYQNYNADAEIDDGSCDVITDVAESTTFITEVYPVPFASILYVQLPEDYLNFEFEILDLQGRLINVDISKQGGLVKIDIDYIPKGLYFLRMLDVETGVLHTKKVIKL